MGNTIRREQRGNGAKAVTDPELPAEDRQQVIGTPRRLQQRFDHARGSGAKRVWSRRPQTRDTRLDGGKSQAITLFLNWRPPGSNPATQ